MKSLQKRARILGIFDIFLGLIKIVLTSALELTLRLNTYLADFTILIKITRHIFVNRPAVRLKIAHRITAPLACAVQSTRLLNALPSVGTIGIEGAFSLAADDRLAAQSIVLLRDNPFFRLASSIERTLRRYTRIIFGAIGFKETFLRPGIRRPETK